MWYVCWGRGDRREVYVCTDKKRKGRGSGRQKKTSEKHATKMLKRREKKMIHIIIHASALCVNE
jgi:hypothetical protein